jgi:hypothetical protein
MVNNLVVPIITANLQSAEKYTENKKPQDFRLEAFDSKCTDIENYLNTFMVLFGF